MDCCRCLLGGVVLIMALAEPPGPAGPCSGVTHPKCGMGGAGVYSVTAADGFLTCCASCDADAACASWTFTADGGDYAAR